MLNSNFRFPFPSSFFLGRYRCFLNLFLLVEGVFSSFFPGFRIRIFFADPDPGKNFDADPDPGGIRGRGRGVKGKMNFFF